MRILLVDDDRDSRAAVRWFLKDRDCEVVECSSGREAITAMDGADFPMVLSDITMPGMSGIELANAIKRRPDGWRTDVVLFTGYADLKSAVTALRAGVYDYLQKPVDAQELALTIDRVAEHQALLRENKKLTDRFADELGAATEETRRELLLVKSTLAESIIGKVGIYGEGSRKLLEQAEKLHHDRSIPVLIQGETGVGKEIVAKIIHYGVAMNALHRESFVDINCGALTPSLFDSELFGYEPGSFTGGSAKGAKGKLDMAQGGTLFLDEISELPLDVQVKLLRVLQEKEFYRVGGLRKIKTDIRIICATNVSLEERIEKGLFRRDLYYRLKVGKITVPPLRERKEEIIPLAQQFLLDAARQKKKRFKTIQPDAAAILLQYSWPGNIRELKNVIEYIAFMHDDAELKPSYLENLLSRQAESCLSPHIVNNNADEQSNVMQVVMPLPPSGRSLKDFADDIIDAVLVMHNGNQTAAAQYLKMSLRALAYRLRNKRTKPINKL